MGGWVYVKGFKSIKCPWFFSTLSLSLSPLELLFDVEKWWFWLCSLGIPPVLGYPHVCRKWFCSKWWWCCCLAVETFANQMGPHVSPCDSLFTHLPPTLCRSSPAAAVACPRALLLSGILLLLLQWWVTDVQSFSQDEEEE